MTSILLCGNNPELLNLRHLVLKQSGYDSTIRLGPVPLEDFGTVKLLILCHTLSAAERIAAIATLHREAPSASILCFQPAPGPAEGAVELINALDGPRKLLEAVNRMLSI